MRPPDRPLKVEPNEERLLPGSPKRIGTAPDQVAVERLKFSSLVRYGRQAAPTSNVYHFLVFCRRHQVDSEALSYCPGHEQKGKRLTSLTA